MIIKVMVFKYDGACTVVEREVPDDYFAVPTESEAPAEQAETAAAATTDAETEPNE